MSNQETVEVTVKIPKAIMDFLEAAKQFSKVASTVEEWCYQQIVFGMRDMLKGNSVDEIFPALSGDRLVIAYGLDKVFDP